MRKLLLYAAFLAITASPIATLPQTASAKPPAGTASPKLAPVDELFGRYGESVLEIQNRIAAINVKDDVQLRMPACIGALDYVADGALAWHQHYPTDPWLAKVLARLVTFYARAGLSASRHAIDAFTALSTAFPSSHEEDQALLALWDSPPVAGQGVVSGQVVAASTGAPVAGAIVMVAPGHESDDLGTTPFATTAGDGSFSVAGVPLEGAEYVLVEPPRGSAYAAYHGKFDPVDGKVVAGVIRLAAR